MTRAPPPLRVPRTPAQTVLFAVGDIHGRLDLLDGFLAELQRASSSAAREGARLVTVFLGDYIDRGPASAGVLQRLIQLQESRADEFVFLRGNHEQVLLDLVDEQEATTRWLNFGGRETLASYGVHHLTSPTPESLRALVSQAVPAQHIEFLRATQLSAAFGDYFFVHAGLRPDRLVEEQSDSDLLWFRYYDDEAPVWDHTVVHGHSPNAHPVVGRWRIAIDTEAYASGALTALRLEGDTQTLLRVARTGSGEVGVAPWEKVDRSYRSTPRERAEARPPKPSPEPARPKAARPEPAKRPNSQKLRQRKRRLAWGTVGALAVVSCTGLMLSARDLVPRTEPAAPSQAQSPGSEIDIQLRSSSAAAPSPLPAAQAVQPAPTLQAKQAIGPPPEAAAATHAATPAAETSPPAPAGPNVQIAAVDTENAAADLWAKLQKKLPEASTNRTLRVEAVEKDGRAFHRVLVAGFADVGEATSFCTSMKQAGQDCLVRSR